VRISYENFHNLLIDAFLPHWLKKYKDYPLGIVNMESVRLMKGKNGIHLDNKEHAILEHCVSPKDHKILVEKDRGFENPEGSVEGYGRVGVRVGIFQPSTYPYPSRGSRGYRGYRRGR
jgi:hypothetical protein